MAVTFRFPSDRSIELVGFAWSPLFESVLSLPVVVEPKRTPLHLPWARRTRELPDDLLAEIRTLVGAFLPYFPGIFEVGLLGDSPEFADEIEAFRSLDDEIVAHELTLGYGQTACGFDYGDCSMVNDPTYRSSVLDAALDDEVLTLVRQAFEDPAALRDRYAVMLERYWELAFADEWARIVPRIEAEVTDGARALVIGGITRLIGELLPEGHWDESVPGVVLGKPYDALVDVADRGRLLFVPTVYGWPKVVVELEPRWATALFVPLRHLRQPTVATATDAEVVSGCRALGDETRLQILRLVADSPRSTKELSSLLSLSDSAISRHLQILDAAGLVTSRRDGYFVLYSLQPDRLDVLGRSLRDSLGITTAGPGGVPPLPVAVSREPVG
jgi:DNA-binding transcriptional ArsR family regulator